MKKKKVSKVKKVIQTVEQSNAKMIEERAAFFGCPGKIRGIKKVQLLRFTNLSQEKSQELRDCKDCRKISHLR